MQLVVEVLLLVEVLLVRVLVVLEIRPTGLGLAGRRTLEIGLQTQTLQVPHGELGQDVTTTATAALPSMKVPRGNTVVPLLLLHTVTLATTGARGVNSNGLQGQSRVGLGPHLVDGCHHCALLRAMLLVMLVGVVVHGRRGLAHHSGRGLFHVYVVDVWQRGGLEISVVVYIEIHLYNNA